MPVRFVAALLFLAAGCASNSVAGGVEYRAVQPGRPRVGMPPAPTEWLGSPNRAATGALVGVVYDCVGAPVAGARVRVRSREAPATDTVLMTDDRGAARLGPIAVSVLVVEVRAMGYATRTFQRALSAGRVDSLSVRLTAAPGHWVDCFTAVPCPPTRMYTCAADP